MIFVTVGTHEQSFERLVRTIDELRGNGIITDHVFMQIGHTRYEPGSCSYRKFVPFSAMVSLIQKSKIVITHGGDCVMLVLKYGKIPIVMPRMKQYGEHVDDHQVAFTSFMAERGLVIPAYERDDMVKVLSSSELNRVAPADVSLSDNTHKFVVEFAKICFNLINRPAVVSVDHDIHIQKRG